MFSAKQLTAAEYCIAYGLQDTSPIDHCALLGISFYLILLEQIFRYIRYYFAYVISVVVYNLTITNRRICHRHNGV